MAKHDVIVGLDIGSGTIKILVASKSPNEDALEVLAFAQEPSMGVRKGVVIDPEKVSEQISLLIKRVEEQINKRISSVYVNVGGSHVFSTNSRGLVSVSRADQKISQEDIERVLQAAQTFPLPANREILEAFPREFIIDGEKGIKSAEGLKGVRLEAEVLLLGAFTPYVKNLTTAVLNSGIQKINDLIFSPLASARAVLSSKEKELGVVLLDIGAGTTNLAIFEEGELVHMSILPIGSSHITNDLAIYLKTGTEIAERIKIDYGSVLFQGQDKKEKIKFDEKEILTFSLKKISRVIEDRVLEIFREVIKELKKIGKTELPAGIVLTGGCAKIPKIKELAKREFHLPSRVGSAKGFVSFQDDYCLSVVCGLVLLGFDEQSQEGNWGKAISGEFGFMDRIKKIFKIFVP
jgi:cell division protein FtsA